MIIGNESLNKMNKKIEHAHVKKLTISFIHFMCELITASEYNNLKI